MLLFKKVIRYSFSYFSKNVIVTVTITFFQKYLRYNYNYISVTFESWIENDTFPKDLKKFSKPGRMPSIAAH